MIRQEARVPQFGIETMKAVSALLLFFVVFPALISAQTPEKDSAPQTQIPSVLKECEENQCSGGKSESTWVFHGSIGQARWNDGAVAELVVERFDPDAIIIQRIDLPTSSSYGLNAVYRGTLHGKRIEGTVVRSWTGHWDGRQLSGKWSATVQDGNPLPAPPPVQVSYALTECEANQCIPGQVGGCAWVLHGSEGESHCRNGAVAKLTIRQFDDSGIAILRKDLPTSSSYGLTAVYTGRLYDGHVSGYATWSWPGHWDDRHPSGKWFATVRSVTSSDLPSVPPPLVSPEVHPDRRVTFRFVDPDAQEVLLEMEGSNPVIMQKDDLGVWSVTTPSLPPDYYGYDFRADGVALIDPSNPLLLPNLLQSENMVHVPGPPSLPWEVGSGPHGAVHHHFYKSRVIGDQRDFYVYTPPGYDPQAKTEYPVLYLLHGFGQESSSWAETGFANIILDHLIAEGRAKPMIVVMPVAYGGTEILAKDAFWNDAIRYPNFNKFTESLLTEVIPRVEHDYHVKKGRDARAIAGLSMGGAESLLTGLNRLDEFAWVGSFSSGGLRANFDQEFPGLDASANAKLHLLWVACGVDDGLIGINRDFRKWLTAKGITHTDVETAGKHTWMVWRRNLANFAPLLFRSR
jgi:enterochelin esterase-like enzyme